MLFENYTRKNNLEVVGADDSVRPIKYNFAKVKLIRA